MKTIAQCKIEIDQQNLYQMIRVGREEVGCCLRGTRLAVEYIEILIKHYQQIDIVINTKTISKNYKIFVLRPRVKKTALVESSFNHQQYEGSAFCSFFIVFIRFHG